MKINEQINSLLIHFQSISHKQQIPKHKAINIVFMCYDH